MQPRISLVKLARDLKHEFWVPQNVAFWKEKNPLFQGNLSWWNIMMLARLVKGEPL